MVKLLDIAGQRFGRLTVLQRLPKKRAKVDWLCRCDCGAELPVLGDSLRSGRTKSCGCLHSDWVEDNLVKHSLSHDRIYIIWQGMIRRCSNTNHNKYSNYGGRGISVCQEWRSFEQFLADMGLPPTPAHTLDRIDNDGNYCPSNCRWADYETQQNNKRDSRRITHNGETLSITQWARKIGLSVSALNWRLKNGWPVERALR